MGDYFSRALRSPDDGSEHLIDVQAPIDRPGPIVRPGDERPARGFAPITNPRAQPPASSGSVEQQQPSGDPSAEWFAMLNRHQVPKDSWPSHADHYLTLRENPNATLDGVPPKLAQDIKGFLAKYPDIVKKRVEPSNSADVPKAPAVPGLPRENDQPPQAGQVPQAPQAARPAEKPTDYFSRAIRGDRPTEIDSKSLTYDYDKTLGFLGQTKASFAATENKWKQIAGASLYPNEAPEKSAARIKKTSDGRWYHVGDDGKSYEVHPPEGAGRLNNIGSAVGGAIPAVGGGVAGLVALPTGPVGSIAAAGIGGYVGETVRQAIGNALSPDMQPEYSRGHAITEGLSNAAGQGLGLGLNRVMARHNPVDIGHYNPAATQQLYDSADRLGVRLTPAEATNMSSLIGDQKRLQASPRAANEMTRFAEERNGEVNTAWHRFLLSIASPRDASALGRQASESATGVLERAQAQRTAAVDPFYRVAEQQIGTINPGQIVRFVDQALPHAKGAERAALQFVQRQLETTDRTAIDTSFRGLNGAKMAIDRVLENPDMAAKEGLDRHAHGTLQAIREMLLNTIDNAPGAGGAAGPYAAGRATYGQMTDAFVTPVQEMLAPLLRANPANSSIVHVAQSVLDPATRSPEIVRQARAMIAGRHPDVWNGMIRQFLQESAMPALQENAKGFVSNAGGNIAKSVGKDAIELNMRAAMTPQQFANYREVLDVFRATGRALDMNSDTAFKIEAIKAAKNSAGGMIARITRNANPAKLLENTSEWFANANYERQAAALARIVTQGNPQAIQALRQLRQLSPADQRRNVILGHLLEQAGEFGVSKAIGEQ